MEPLTGARTVVVNGWGIPVNRAQGSTVEPRSDSGDKTNAVSSTATSGDQIVKTLSEYRTDGVP